MIRYHIDITLGNVLTTSTAEFKLRLTGRLLALHRAVFEMRENDALVAYTLPPHLHLASSDRSLRV
jgi:hypothetical protein